MEGKSLTVADRCTSKCCILVFQDTVQSAHDAGTGASNRMTQGNGASENIHSIQIKVQDPARKGEAKLVTKRNLFALETMKKYLALTSGTTAKASLIS